MFPANFNNLKAPKYNENSGRKESGISKFYLLS